MALGDLYFDVLLNDKTDQGINAIKSKLSKIGADVGADVAKGIQSQLNNIKLNGISAPNLNVTASLAIDKNKLLADIQDALKSKEFTIDIKAKSNITTNANKSTLAYETEAQAKLINAQARLLNAQNAQAVSAQKAALAQAKLRTEHQKTAREANRAQIEATKLARQRQMLANATNRATQSTRAYNNANRSTLSSLREMTGLAGKFSAIYMGGQFLSSLIKIRGEFEMQLVSLRAIMQSTERANELYGQLQQLSVISPFQFGDLVKYAKQLSAFQIPTNELYDTTKRLADLSAGVGVGMDRLILAYGQVRSAAVLRGTELRQFTEAGIPMVGLLADKFSELEGRVISAGEVFDKISNREVPFEMVKEVIEDLTSEGGMFFEMQEKQAQTLQGQISNLKDAYAIMMNEIGQSTEGILKGGVGAIRWALQNYEELLNILVSIGTAYGVYRLQVGYKTAVMGKDTMATLQNAMAEKQLQATKLGQEALTRRLTAQEQYLISTRGKLTQTDYRLMIANGQLTASQVKMLFLTKKITREQFLTLSARAGMTRANRLQIANMTQMQIVGERLKLSLAGVGRAFKTLGATMMASWPMLLMGILTELIMKFSQIGEEQKRINEELKQNAQQALTDIQNFYKSHKVTFSDLEVGRLSEEEAKKAVEKSIDFINSIAPTNPIVFEAQIDAEEGDLAKLQKADEILKALQETAQNASKAFSEIKINEDTWGWGIFGEGLKTDAKDLNDAAKDMNEALELYAKAGVTIGELRKIWENTNSRGFMDTLRNSGLTRGGIYDASNLKSNMQDYMAQISEASNEVKKFAQDNNAALANLKGVERIAEIQRQVSVLKTTFEGVDAFTMGRLINVYENEVGSYYNTLNHIVSNFTNEEKKRIEELKGDYTGANEETLRSIVNNTANRLDLVFDMAKMTADEISKLESFINVFLNIVPPTDVPLTGLQNYLKDFIPSTYSEDAKEQLLRKFAGLGDDYSKIRAEAYKIKAEEERTINELKQLPKLNDAQKEQLNTAIMNKNALEGMISNMALVDPNASKPSTPKKSTYNAPKSNYTSQEKQVDAYTKALEEQYKTYKDIYDKWETLSEKVGSEKAIEYLKEMPGYKEIFDDEDKKKFIVGYLKKGGDKDLIKYYLETLGQRATEEAKNFRKNLQGGYISEAVKDISEQIDEEAEALKKALEKISEAYEEGYKELERWSDIYEKTGNKGIANAFVVGKWNKPPTNKLEYSLEYLDKMLKDTEWEGLSFEELINPETLEKLPDEVKKMLDKISDIKRQSKQDTEDKIIDAIVETMSIDEQIKKIEQERDSLLAEYDKIANPKNYLQNLIARNAVIAQAANQIAELKAKLQDLLPVWDRIFNAEDGDYKGVKEAMKTINEMLENARFSRSTPEGQNIYTATYTDENGQIQVIELTSEKIEELKEKYKDLTAVLVEKNPFKAIKDLFSELKNEDGKIDWKNVGKGIASIADLGAEAAENLKGMFEAMGMEGATEAMEWTNQALEGVSNIASGFAEGGLIGGISATFGVVTGFLTSIFTKHDEKLKKQIEESQRVVAQLQSERERIEQAIERSLGGAYGTSGGKNAYLDILQKLKYEREELDKQYADQLALKNQDEDAINDLKKEMAELDDQIRHFAEDTLSDLMGINLKEWASTLGDALVEAFANGEDAASAFDKSVGEMMKSVVKNMASMYILEPMMENLRTYLFGVDGKGGVFGSDYYLDEDELSGMKKYLDVIRDKGVPAVKDLYEGVDSALGGLMSTSTMEGLSGGIKSVTEDTANLLASYLNAVRADVALIASGNPRMTTIAEAQLVQLNAIALNTSRNALAAESINELLRSVTTTTNQGRVLKV